MKDVKLLKESLTTQRQWKIYKVLKLKYIKLRNNDKHLTWFEIRRSFRYL